MTVRVVELKGLALVQDLGRPGHMHEGLAPGGALAVELLALANRAVGNAAGAAAIELFGAMTLEAEGPVTVGTEDGTCVRLRAGERLAVTPRRELRVRYVAIDGGIEAPLILGSRSAALHAGIGARLATGARVSGWPAGKPRTHTLASTATLTSTETAIRVVPGPDLARFAPNALASLLSRAWVISPESDRVGTRLHGEALARLDHDDARSAPLVCGAIEVPAAGHPIVLGPDHPTTGGYPVIAVVARADHSRFFARPLGSEVRFCDG